MGVTPAPRAARRLLIRIAERTVTVSFARASRLGSLAALEARCTTESSL